MCVCGGVEVCEDNVWRCEGVRVWWCGGVEVCENSMCGEVRVWMWGSGSMHGAIRVYVCKIHWGCACVEL